MRSLRYLFKNQLVNLDDFIAHSQIEKPSSINLNLSYPENSRWRLAHRTFQATYSWGFPNNSLSLTLAYGGCYEEDSDNEVRRLTSRANSRLGRDLKKISQADLIVYFSNIRFTPPLRAFYQAIPKK